jgi:uncharacterized membrane protein
MNKIMKIASFLKSDENGIIICIIGTVAQALHTYSIILEASQLPEVWMQHTQAIIVGIFFSLSLAIYTFRAGSVDKTLVNFKVLENQYKKYAISLFRFEFIINLHYWTKERIVSKLGSDISDLTWENITIDDWYSWLITLFISYFLPYMISSYAGHINIPNKSLTKKDNYLFKILSKKRDKKNNMYVELQLKK